MGSKAFVLDGPSNITGFSFLFRSLKSACVAYAPLSWEKVSDLQCQQYNENFMQNLVHLYTWPMT